MALISFNLHTHSHRQTAGHVVQGGGIWSSVQLHMQVTRQSEEVESRIQLRALVQQVQGGAVQKVVSFLRKLRPIL
jgi:hypothetical protein